MKTRKKLWIFLLSLFCLVLGGCGAQEGETEAEAPGKSLLFHFFRFLQGEQ